MTTTLKLGPLPNSVAEWPHRDVKALGRATCKNSKEECTCVYSVPVVCTYTVWCITIIYNKECSCRTPAILQLPTDNAIITLHSSECVLSYNVHDIDDRVYCINVSYFQAWVCHFPQHDSKKHRYSFPHYLLIVVQTGLLYPSACIHVTGYIHNHTNLTPHPVVHVQ